MSTVYDVKKCVYYFLFMEIALIITDARQHGQRINESTMSSR